MGGARPPLEPPMLPAELFRFCPRCGAARPPAEAGRAPFRCPGCDLTLFFNPAVAAGAWVFDGSGRVLLVRRAHDPQKGKLGLPGGFLDAGEGAVEGLRREVREEVGLEVERVAFLASVPNRYEYRGVTYPVVDLIFTAEAVAPETARAADEVAGIEWHPPADVDPADLAFPSMRETVGLLARASN
ncbi:MAG: NUDIX domain-containing protein [Gemmataceae bacterium]|nr:NUDIX domain-containing protein [Gemmataceae bacterium]